MFLFPLFRLLFFLSRFRGGWIVIAWIASMLAGANAGAQLPAFPGAVGFGANATGGRGGTVYHVTNLNDSGTGSFRDAVAHSNRIVVFDVGGYIRIKSAVSCSDNVTIAGESAPGDGVGVYGAEFSFSGASNVICRHIRFRQTDLDPNTGKSALAGDSADTVIMDHISIEFGQWDNIDVNSSTAITFQNMIDADPIGQQFNAHADSDVTWFNNIWSSAHNRNPLAKGNIIYANNVVYNFGAGFTAHTSGVFSMDIVNNYFITGPSTTNANDAFYQIGGNVSIFGAGNMRDSSRDGNLNGGSISVPTSHPLGAPWTPVTVTLPTLSARAAYKRTVSVCGATPFHRDEVDSQVIADMTSLGTKGRHWKTQTSTGLGNGGLGTLAPGTPIADADHDGMPDWWESALGLNPNSAADALATAASGYKNIEEYLHWLADPHAAVEGNTSGDVDLRDFTSGLNPGATYAVTAAPAHGVATLIAAVGDPAGTPLHIVHFVPVTNFVGRDRFTFSGTDSDGDVLTDSVGIVVTVGLTAPPANIKWKGDGVSNNWKAADIVTNFLKGTTAVAFNQGDSVTFDDSGSNTPSVNLTGTVTPSALVVSSGKNYTFAGTGLISGSMTLVKSGAGALIFGNSGANSFSGGTKITGGAIAMGSANSLGTGPFTIDGATLILPASGTVANGIAITAPTTIVLSGGVTLGGSMDIGDATAINTSSGGTFNPVLTGAGALTFNISNSTLAVNCDFSGFTGSVGMGASTGTFYIRSAAAMNFANIALDAGGVTIKNHLAAGVSSEIGALSGGAGAKLAGSDNGNGFTDTFVIGGLNLDTIFAGAIQNGVSGGNVVPVAITKTGTGTLTLSGPGSYTGATTVAAGTLRVLGALGNTAVTVQSGATLAGNGTIGGSVNVLSGAHLALGTSGSAGTLTIGGGLTLVDTTLTYDLANVTTSGGGVNDLINLTGGTLALSGTITFQPNLVNGALTSGTYTLITGGTATTGSWTPVWGGDSGTRVIYSIDQSQPGKVLLVVNGSPASLVWSGSNGAAWDYNNTVNWTNAGVPDTFYTQDAVTFDDTATSGSAGIVGAVQPQSVTVSNAAKVITLGGSGGITGAAALTKTGAGNLIVGGSNSYTGGTFLNGGTLTLASNLANTSGLGTGAVTLDGGTLTMFSAGTGTFTGPLPNQLIVPTAGTLNAAPRCGLTGALTGSGTLTLFIPYVRTDITGDWSGFSGRIKVVTDADGGDFRFGTSYSYPGFPNAALDLSDKVTAYFIGTLGKGGGTFIDVGEIAGTAGAVLKGGLTGGRRLTYRVGGRNTDATFAGTIAEAGASTVTSFLKTGAGTWTLSGTSAFNGDTTVEQGALAVSGAVTNAGIFDVKSGATLALADCTITTDTMHIETGGMMTGCGTIHGEFINDGSVFADCGGTLTLDGAVTNNGIMIFSNFTTLNASGPFINNGELDIDDASQIPPGFVNNGVLKISGHKRTPFQVWQRLHFGNSATNDAIAGELADPDLDSLPNLLEYALYLDPNQSSVTGLPQSGSGGGFISLTCTRVNSATDIAYQVQWSPDLVNWFSTGITEETLSDDGTTQQVKAKSALAGATVKFIRLQITHGATTVRTVPLGLVNTTVPAGANLAVSTPFHAAAEAAGVTGSVTGSNSLTVANANWTADQFTATPHLARITGGAGAGREFLIVSNTTSQLTLDTRGYVLTGSAPSQSAEIQVQANDALDIVPANTLGSLFGTGAVPFQTGADAGVADTVQLWNGSAWDVYFHDGASWKKSGAAGDWNSAVILPGRGMFITRRANTPVDLTFLGTVLSNTGLNDVPGPGTTFPGSRFPLTITLKTFGLHLLAGWQGNADPAVADGVLIWNGTTWSRFYHDGTNWHQSGVLGIMDGRAISPAVAVLVKRRGTASGTSATLVQPLPYTP